MKFYATLSYGHTRRYMPNVPYLLPASSWARGMRKDGSLPKPTLPTDCTDLAADCGGFVASRIWGEYRYSPQQYVDWLHTFNPKWAATMDYCCEPPITQGQQKSVVERQCKTTLNAWLFWDEYRDAQWCWIPTIQGWEVADYVRHATEMKPLIDQMQSHYGANSEFRVGLGTLCARASNSMILQVILAVREVLPDVKFHLWGVKLGFIQSRIAIPEGVISFDSAAWSPGGLGTDGVIARKERLQLGITQKEHDYTIALPRYASKIQNALAGQKQLVMF